VLLGRSQSHANTNDISNRIGLSFSDALVVVDNASVSTLVSDASLASKGVCRVKVVDADA